MMGEGIVFPLLGGRKEESAMHPTPLGIVPTLERKKNGSFMCMWQKLLKMGDVFGLLQCIDKVAGLYGYCGGERSAQTRQSTREGRIAWNGRIAQKLRIAQNFCRGMTERSDMSESLDPRERSDMMESFDMLVAL